MFWKIRANDPISFFFGENSTKRNDLNKSSQTVKDPVGILVLLQPAFLLSCYKEIKVLIFGDQWFHSSLIPVSSPDHIVLFILSLRKGNFPTNGEEKSKDQ